ncbi:MAG: DUF6703 family protein [Nocardioidaceae bacterium]
MATPNSSQQGSSATREALSARSRGILLQLSQLPTLVIPGAMLVLMLVGLSAPLPFALPALAVIAVFVAWLAYLSWPILDSRARLLRIVMLAVVIGAAVARLLGWL